MRHQSAQKKRGVSFPQTHVPVWEVLAQAEVEEVSARMRRITLTRSFLTLGMFVIATLLSLKFPWWGFGAVCSVLLVYLWPEGLRFSYEDAGHGETE